MVRVTQTMINQSVLQSIQNNITHMAVLQEKLATGRRISRPSDSPIDFTLSLSIRANITQGRTFMRNINSARTSLEIAETTMGNLTETLKDVRTLALQGANNVDYNARLAIANQISEMYEHVLSLANTGYNGRRIFGGTQSKDEPFVGKGGSVLYLGDDFDQDVLVGKGNQIKTNLNGFETFLHTPNTITGSTTITDTAAPLAEQLRIANPNFPNLPAHVDPLTGATVERSPNPSNSPTVLPNNYASFWIHDKEIKVDLSVDSLEDVVTRINANVDDVTASISDSNQLVITSRRSDSLVLQDGSRNIGFEADLPQEANILSALGMHQIVPGGRSLNLGFPATDPLVDGTTLPTPSRSSVNLTSGTFLFAATETGPSNSVSTPFADNMALSDVDLDGNEQVDANGNPVFIDKLEALRITINEDVYDIDLRSLTEGTDFDGLSGNFDDVPGSDLGDLYNLINNHPDLKGKVTAYTNKDGYGMEISAVNSTDVFKVENVRKMFGRDITTRVTVDALGEQTITREGVITRDTALDDLPGTMIDPAANMGSLGIRRADPLPAGMPPAMNKGLIVITNGEFTEAVDLRDAETIGDILDRINDSNTGVRAKINEWGTGLEIESIVSGNGELSIIDMDEGTVARDLGFIGTPPPARIQSDPGFLTTDVVGAGGLATVGSGSFEIEVRDGNGITLDTYSIDIAAGDTIDDVITKINEIDGNSSAGGGLISAGIDTATGTINIFSNFNANTIYIDSANDTTATAVADRLTSVLNIDQYTSLNEVDALTYGSYVSNQNSASIMGVASEGQINEIEEKNIFRTIRNLERALREDDTLSIEAALDDIDLDLETILNRRTQLGARINRIDSEEARLQTNEDFSRQELSGVEDADFAELITDLSLAENAFNAALQAASRVVQQTLLNFLR